MSFSLSVDAQEFVPGNGLDSSSKTKLCSSLSVDAQVFIPVVANDSENSVEQIPTSFGKDKNKPSAVQRRGRFAQVDCRGNSNQKSVDIFKGPSIPQVKKESAGVSEWASKSSNTDNRVSKETSDKKKLKHSFSLEYAKRRKQLTSSFDEKILDEQLDDFKHDKVSSGESKPIVLWSSIVKKEPTDEIIQPRTNINEVEVSDEKPSKKYSKNKVTRTKNVLSESANEKFQRNLFEKKKRDFAKLLPTLNSSSGNKFDDFPLSVDNKTYDASQSFKQTKTSNRKNIELPKQGSNVTEFNAIKTNNLSKSSSEDMNTKNKLKREVSLNTFAMKVQKKDIGNNDKKQTHEDQLVRQTNSFNNLSLKKKKIPKLPKKFEKDFQQKDGQVLASIKNVDHITELVDMNLLDISTFPALSMGRTETPRVPVKSYSAATKRVLTVEKRPALPNVTSGSSVSQNIIEALNNMKLTEEEKRALRKRQKALKRKMKVKLKKQEFKLTSAANNREERFSEKEMTFDLSDMFSKLLQVPVDVKKSQRTAKSKKLKVSTGVISVVSGLAKKNTPDGRRMERNKYGTTHTLLDGTTIKKRGKERETPKKKRPTLLKKVIQAERDRKRALQVSTEKRDQILKEETLDDMESKEDTVVEKVDQISELPEDVWKKIHSKKFREYCDHVLTKDINHLTYNLLVSLQKFQDRVYHENRNKYKQKRRFILGLREVLKHLKLKRLKAIVIAPNIERISAKGGLDDYLGSIISICNEQGIPKIFAMNRHVLGRVVKKLAPVSVIGIFDYDGAHETFKELVSLVTLAKETYKEKVDNLLKEGNQSSSSNLDVYPNSIPNDLTPQFDLDSNNHIKSQMLSKLCFNDYNTYEVESESDWVTDNESAPL